MEQLERLRISDPQHTNCPHDYTKPIPPTVQFGFLSISSTHISMGPNIKAAKQKLITSIITFQNGLSNNTTSFLMNIQ